MRFPSEGKWFGCIHECNSYIHIYTGNFGGTARCFWLKDNWAQIVHSFLILPTLMNNYKVGRKCSSGVYFLDICWNDSAVSNTGNVLIDRFLVIYSSPILVRFFIQSFVLDEINIQIRVFLQGMNNSQMLPSFSKSTCLRYQSSSHIGPGVSYSKLIANILTHAKNS
jgi:hypothetical protein